jgi:hypothetical protein
MLGPDQVLGVPRIPLVQQDMRPLWVEARAAQALGLRDGQVVQGLVQVNDGRVRLWLRDFSFGIPNGWNLKEGDKPFLRADLQPGGWGLLIQPGDPTTAVKAPTPAVVARGGTELMASTPMAELAPAGDDRLATLLAMRPTLVRALAWLQPGLLGMIGWQGQRDIDLVQRFQAMSLNMANLSPMALRKSVMMQGRAMEHRLSIGEEVEDDPKSLIRQLLSSLSDREESKSVNRLSEEMRALLDELESAQLQAAQAQQRGELSLHVVLPFVDADPVVLHFYKPPREPSQEPPPLSVDIHSRSRVLGALWLNTMVRSSRVIDLTMWAERSDIAELARENASELRHELEMAGLELRSFQIHDSPRPGFQQDVPGPQRGSVVDALA